jgi:NTP pyrophosphatase (non-canonical NTP hydrolase)
MNLHEYQQQIVSIWENQKNPDELLLFCCAGMEEEAGEAQGKVKRWMRGEGFDREGYLKELGDVLAYFVMAAYSKGRQMGIVSSECSCTVDSPLMLFKTTHALVKRTALFTDNALANTGNITDFSAVLVQISWCANDVGSDLQEVMQLNLDKLNS